MSTERRPCPVCEDLGSRDCLWQQRFVAAFPIKEYDVCICQRCGAAFADRIPKQAELDAYYAGLSKYEYGFRAGLESDFDLQRFDNIADQLEPIVEKDAAILDIGCATGGFLGCLKKRGYCKLKGIDPSRECVEAAKRIYGVEATDASFADIERAGERFDVISMIGVLEHVRDVNLLVSRVKGLLKPRGRIYCAQPDVGAFERCVNAPFQQFSTEHINFFSAKSLDRLFRSHGFSPTFSWFWLVEWRQGVMDSVVSMILEEGSPANLDAAAEVYDDISKPALEAYIESSKAVDQAKLTPFLAALASSGQPVLVWGAGTLVRRLLEMSPLANVNIVAFVDSDRRHQGELLAGRQIIAPKEVGAHSCSILIGSKAFEYEIIEAIQGTYDLQNELIRLP